ncbi:hypothetical protein ACWN6Y_08540 [Vagococcus teuberi]|uniref:Lipoprotein n=1 Tax=Vagococcus teuberi TaxID=519472 RepID=A0A1J0A713_9ENTE|nr:hypothetical protein [Vagococcus teuberi]APB31720.1 hypothetical protein BHY08_07690 [Vagococcus teuberi]
MKKDIIFVGMIGILGSILVGCSSDSGKKNTAMSTEIPSETSESIDATKSTEVTNSTTSELEPLSKKDTVEATLESLQQGLSQMFDISFDEKNERFLLEVKKDSPVEATFLELVNNPSPDSEQQVKDLSASLSGFSESVSESLGANYSIELVNNYNDKGSFFVIKNGDISFPYLESK